MPCPQCDSPKVIQRKSGTQTGEYCGDCGKWIRWVPIGSIEDFVWPVGSKHKGKTLGTIVKIDPDYLKWAAENMTASKNLKKRATEILEKYNLIPKAAPHVPINSPQTDTDTSPW